MRQFATPSQSLVENARLMAVIWTAQGDVTAGCRQIGARGLHQFVGIVRRPEEMSLR